MRKLSWQQDLAAYLASCKETEFVWGTFDCCLFAANCAKVICGKDPAEVYRGSYETEIGAKKALLRNHKSIGNAFGASFEEIPVGMVQRGDIVTFVGDFGETAGVLWGGKIWTVTYKGLVAVAPKLLRAWRVE